MTGFNELKKKLMKEPEFAAEYDALAPEFAVASELIRARIRAGMTQEDVAAKMQVTQSRIAKMEGGINISVEALKRYADATGATLSISLDPAG